MIFSFRAPTGQTGYAVELRSSTSATVLQTIPLAESGNSGEFFLTAAVTLAAGVYRVIVTKNGEYLQTATSPLFWNGSQQTTLATLSTQIAGVSGGGTGGGVTVGEVESLVNTARDIVLARGNEFWTPNNTGIQSLLDRLTAARATKLDTVATAATADAYKANLVGIATTLSVTSARDSVITRGDIAWVTGSGGGGTGGGLSTDQDAKLTGIHDVAFSDLAKVGELFYQFRKGTTVQLTKKARTIAGSTIELKETP